MKSVSQIPVTFAFQSYHDSVIDEKAILPQPKNELIVPSTRHHAQGAGYVIGISGSSNCPVAFKFTNDSAVFVCRPGQAIKVGKFESFEYGLPFGWLGGGHATIFVGHSPEAILDLGAATSELIFHRTRLIIEASGANLPALKRNWPLHFPWTRAVRDAAAIDQRGSPILRVTPTRTLLRLRSQIATDKVVGLVFRGSREFDEASDGTFTLSNTTSTFAEVAFKASTDPSLALYPVAELPASVLHLACDEGGVTALGLGDAALTGVEIDVVRFGRL